MTQEQLGSALILGAFGIGLIILNRVIGRTIEILVGSDAASALGYRRKPGGNYLIVVVGGLCFVAIAIGIVVFSSLEGVL